MRRNPVLFYLFAVSLVGLLCACQPITATPTFEGSATTFFKIDSLLRTRLQTVTPDEPLLVGIWAAPVPGAPSLDTISAQVWALYPSAEGSGPVFTDPDPALAAEMNATYVRLLSEAVAARMKPLVEYLQGIGVDIKFESSTIPTTVARMTRAQIEEAVTSPLVAFIELAGNEAGPASTSNTP